MISPLTSLTPIRKSQPSLSVERTIVNFVKKGDVFCFLVCLRYVTSNKTKIRPLLAGTRSRLHSGPDRRKRFIMVSIIHPIRRIAAVILCFLALWGCTSSQKDQNPEQFGQSILESFRNNEPDRYAEYLLTEKQFTELLEQSSIPTEHKKMVAAKWPRKIKQLHQSAAKRFNAIRKIGRRDGVDWPKTEFVKTEFESTAQKPEEWKSNFDIIFTCSDLYFKIRFKDCLKTDKGWFLAGPPRWVQMHGYQHADRWEPPSGQVLV